ncbi:MAG: ABC transporter permease, partial [Candidatus Saccharibacteria bacterium]|nr:ABC transporter permease [Pseudorhodobacter sp.]
MRRPGLPWAGPAGIVLLAGPVLAGFATTVWPAFQTGYGFTALIQWPGLPRAVLLSLGTGLFSTLAALLLTLLILATLQDRPLFRWVRRSLSPLLAVPHAAAALGFAFLIAPSGWIARALSPWATGWHQPPDLLILNDPWGISLTLGLITKELPFLLIIALAALPPTAARRLHLAASMGYGTAAGFFLTVVPALYPALRLPVLAVLTYGMTNVDMALILGPTTPPPLAVQITRWMTEPGLTRTNLAAAAALLQAALTLAALALWRGGELAVATLGHAITLRGWRMHGLDRMRGAITALALLMGLALTLGILSLGLWSTAGLWPFPDALPRSLTLTAWRNAAPALTATALTPLINATLATAAAMTLTLAWLQAEHRCGWPKLPDLVIYLPLILPQICVLPGLEPAALPLGATGGVASVTAAHLIFVLPYTYLTLSGPFRAGDSRIATVAATLGASEARIFWRLRLPL